MWQVRGVQTRNLHFILQCETQAQKSLGTRTGRASRFTYVPLLPKSGWVGSGLGLAAGETAHSPAPALAPNNAASPSPSPLSGGLLGSRH